MMGKHPWGEFKNRRPDWWMNGDSMDTQVWLVGIGIAFVIGLLVIVYRALKG